MQTEPEQWAVDVAYLAKLADWAAGQGFCQIEGLDDPEDWCLEAYDSFYPMRYGANYSAQALACGLIASIQRAFEERERKLLARIAVLEFEANGPPAPSGAKAISIFALKDTTHD